MVLSRGARLTESIIRAARAQRGGVRECGRPYLARRLGCSTRTVSRYVAELRQAGRLDVQAPRRVRTPKGWRTAGVNRYRLPARPDHAPHVTAARHTCRSRRGDAPVTPPLTGSGGTAVSARPAPVPGSLIDPAHAAAALLHRLGYGPPA